MNRLLFDLDKSAGGNLIRHVFTTNDVDRLASTEIRHGRTRIIEVRSETGQVAIIARSPAAVRFATTPTVFVRQSGRDRCVTTPLSYPVPEAAQNAIAATWTTRLSLEATEGQLRTPQKGALHALLAHWTKSTSPATIVLPTGTGKTETLLLAALTRRAIKTLVLVPTDPLRDQTFERACTWGHLRGLGVLPEDSVEYPVVGKLRKSFSDSSDAERFFDSCQVIVSTVPLINRIDDNAFDRLLRDVELVIIDEAHHIAAATWTRAKERFSDRLIVHFTATPFRQDGKHIGGEILYTYPHSRAQSDEFFSTIHFHPTRNYNPIQADQELAEQAVQQLRADLGEGRDHALMARAKKRDRADSLIGIYRKLAPDLNPVILHTGLRAAERRVSKEALLNSESRIIVCVDMLGEGFDFPKLKVAALHDIHKTLPITLQFIGRFTRTADDSIGDATVFANIADTKVRDALTILYSQDADWNRLIQATYDDVIDRELADQEFIRHFQFNDIEVFSLSNIEPTFTVYLFHITDDAELSRLLHDFNDGAIHRLALNQRDDVAVVVSRLDTEIEWGRIAALQNTNFVCTAFYLARDRNLLFVYSSDKADPSDFVRVIDPAYRRFQGRSIFRTLHGVNRLLLQNLGLKKSTAGPIRYRQFIGADVGMGVREQVREGSYAAMVSGTGYEDASKVTIGCSPKGKIWSRNGGRILEWVEWCQGVAAKIVDDTINIDIIFEGVLYPEQVDAIPDDRSPIGADWNEFFFSNMFERASMLAGDVESPAEEASIAFRCMSDDRKELGFNLLVREHTYTYTLTIDQGCPEGYCIACDGQDVEFVTGRNHLSGQDFFLRYPPVFWLDDCSCLADGCLLVQSRRDGYGGTFSLDAIATQEWQRQGVNIRVESQGIDKLPDSIQRRVIQDIEDTQPLVVFDDDGSGEMADVVAIYEEEDRVLFRLHHCKFSSEDEPGCRVKDVQEVACQAQKSVKWAGSAHDAIEHLEKRERRRRRTSDVSRFEIGSMDTLDRLRAVLRSKPPAWEVVLVQPGLSRRQLAAGGQRPRGILRILGATQAYLSETYNMRLRVLVSP